MARTTTPLDCATDKGNTHDITEWDTLMMDIPGNNDLTPYHSATDERAHKGGNTEGNWSKGNRN